MFCNQCEQTTKNPMGDGCTVEGVCGKKEDTSTLQDLVIYVAKGISQYATRARKFDIIDQQVDEFLLNFLFTTLTNVNFDNDSLQSWLLNAATMRDTIKQKYEQASNATGENPEKLQGPASWQPAADLPGLIKQGSQVSLMMQRAHSNEDIAGLVSLLTFGLKGVAAYAAHAQTLGNRDDNVYATIHECLDFLLKTDPTVNELLTWNLKLGELNLTVMEMLDTAHTGSFGHPEPTVMRTTPIPGKALLVSGHDIQDLKGILDQTAGKGINVYTHGELLPAHAYPEIKAYPHLVGNYGGAWQDQQQEFDAFPGAIIMTSNCIIEPKASYINRIFTAGPVAWPGVVHLPNSDDYSLAIEASLAASGFTDEVDEHTITIGFAHKSVLGVADKVVDAVKSGAIKHFYLIGGCDGAKSGRNYYTDFAANVPQDSVVLTLGCGKYRFNKQDFGEIAGIPRLLDIGQCNDTYSAIQIAVALADAFECDVNELPLSFIISWFEQKAVAVLLTLLHLGIKGIRLGPTLPTYLTPNLLNVLVEKFDIKPIKTAKEDLEEIQAA